MEIWSHRGEHVNLPENSPAAVEKSRESGFAGVEVDVFYDDEHGLVVSHDFPYIPVNGKTVLLSDVIYGHGPDFRFWLDLKNLERSNAIAVTSALNGVFQKERGLKERTYIESGNGNALRRLNSEFKCIYWIQYQRGNLRGFFKLLYTKFLMSRTKFEGITTDHRYIDASFKNHFKGNCWYVFTVNSTAELETWKSVDEVQVVLTDLAGHEIFKSTQ